MRIVTWKSGASVPRKATQSMQALAPAALFWSHEGPNSVRMWPDGMKESSKNKLMASRWIIQIALAVTMLTALLQAQQLSLQSLVTPSTVILKDGRPVTFALHGFIEFKSLSELFPYIDSQTTRWKPDAITAEQRQNLAHELLRRGIESRIISMTDERPLES